MRRARYVLTARAAADLREARAWSRARWGKGLTARYFDDLLAVSRQGRDVPAILQKWCVAIRRELIEIRARIERGEIVLPKRASAEQRRKKLGLPVPFPQKSPQ